MSKKGYLRHSSFILFFLAWAFRESLGSDCNRNGVDDRLDINRGNSSDCNQNLIPDECDLAPQLAFNAPTIFFTDGLTATTSGDFDGDADVDVGFVHSTVACPEKTGTFQVLFNSGAGLFTLGESAPLPVNPLSVTAGDWNGDGHLDIAVANAAWVFCKERGSISILLNEGNGSFSPRQDLVPNPNALFITAVDLDNDGDLDLAAAVGAIRDGHIEVLTNDGRGAFSPSLKLLFVGFVDEQPTSLTFADLNSD